MCNRQRVEFGAGTGATSLSPLGTVRSDQPRQEQERACEHFFGRLTEQFPSGNLTARDHIHAIGVENVKAARRTDAFVAAPNQQIFASTPPLKDRLPTMHAAIDELAFDAAVELIYNIQNPEQKCTRQHIEHMIIHYDFPTETECGKDEDVDYECEPDDEEAVLEAAAPSNSRAPRYPLTHNNAKINKSKK